MAFSSGFDDEDEVMGEINMTPLVDVMLVLLIIFIITVPVLTHSVKLDLPRAASQPNEVKPKTVNLSIDAQGRMFWNETPVDEAALEQRLAGVARETPQPELHLRADRAVRYEHVAAAMAAAKRAGVQKLGFVTDPGR